MIRSALGTLMPIAGLIARARFAPDSRRIIASQQNAMCQKADIDVMRAGLDGHQEH
jgi:hypothetical protein